ncbi:MAG: hypothetical protein IT449_12470 [Phycisphaerales bacterium]|nr:hypothetical protein [Phycisphaerales bacterium]
MACVVTDRATFAYFSDVFIDERSLGLLHEPKALRCRAPRRRQPEEEHRAGDSRENRTAVVPFLIERGSRAMRTCSTHGSAKRSPIDGAVRIVLETPAWAGGARGDARLEE